MGFAAPAVLDDGFCLLAKIVTTRSFVMPGQGYAEAEGECAR